MNRRTFLASLVAAAGLGMAKATGIAEPLEPEAFEPPKPTESMMSWWPEGFEFDPTKTSDHKQRFTYEARETVPIWSAWVRRPDGTYGHGWSTSAEEALWLARVPKPPDGPPYVML